MYRKMVRKNSEWPKMAVPNFFQQFSQKDWYKFKMAIPNFFQQFFPERPIKFRMAKNDGPKFFPTIFPKGLV